MAISPPVIQRLLLIYAGALLAAGVAAYVLSERHSVVALGGGIAGSVLVALLSMLYRRRVLWSRPALLSAVSIFLLSFVWRAIEAFASGALASAGVLGLLALISLPVFVVLLRTWDR